MNIIDIYKRFPTEEHCVKHLELIRWGDLPVCPYCGSMNSLYVSKELRHHCNNCNTRFSVTVGTVFHNTKLPLQKWFLAIALILNAKKGISSRQLARDISVNKDTAWRMQMQIRKALEDNSGELLEGIVEADEVLIGGKEKNKHNDKRIEGGQGGAGKAVVIGVKQRDGKVKAKKANDRSGNTLKSFIKASVKKGSLLSTDEWKGYNGLNSDFFRVVVTHSSGEYVQGLAHTNGIENFWSLLKRGIIGQYHKVSAKYLDNYIDEFCFRYNNRKNKNLFEETLFRTVKC